MRTVHYWLGTAFLLGVSVSAPLAIRFQSGDPLADVRVSRSYRASDFGSIDLEGVCQITPETVTCWDGQGKGDTLLAGSFKDYLSANPNCILYVGYGRKTRFAVFRKQGVRRLTPDGGFITLGWPKGSDGQTLTPIGMAGGGQSSFTSGQYYEEDTAPEELRYEIDAPRDTKTATLLFPLTVTLGLTRLPLHPGSTGQIGPMTVRITGIRKASRTDFGRLSKPHRQKTAWIVSIETTGYPGSAGPLLYGSPLDAKGEEIRQVEASGEPIPLHSTRGTYFEGPHPRPTYFAGLVSKLGNKPSEQEIWLFADPAKVSALSLAAGGTRKVEVTDIPLDPVDLR